VSGVECRQPALDLGVGSKLYDDCMRHLHLAFGILILLDGTTASAQHPAMPANMSHEEHLRQMEKDEALKRRGALAMGFNQDKTEHHFLLQRTGGAIVVTSKDVNDTESIAQIRSHIREIAGAFADGLFDKPLATHDELPPGAAILSARKALVSYRYQERADGASVQIETSDREAIQAVHDFLRYQIVEHKTGDPLTPKN
jgi:hypothetical protein